MVKACIDNINGVILPKNYRQWAETFYDLSGRQFGNLFGEVTGEELFDYEDETGVARSDELKWKYWKIKRSELKSKIDGTSQYSLHIKGCPAKSLNEGKNYDTISLFDLKKEVVLLTNFLGVVPKDIFLKPGETSLTIHPKANINIDGRFLLYQNELCKNFYRDESDVLMGITVKNAHYKVKVYSVNVKYPELTMPALRIERKYNRNSTFTRATELQTWEDIIEVNGARKNFDLIEQTVDELIIFDPSLRPDKTRFNKRMLECITRGSNPDFWKEKKKKLDSKTYWKLVNEYRDESNISGEGLYFKIKQLLMIEKDNFLAHQKLILNENTQLVTSCMPCNNLDTKRLNSSTRLREMEGVDEDIDVIVRSISTGIGKTDLAEGDTGISKSSIVKMNIREEEDDDELLNEKGIAETDSSIDASLIELRIMPNKNNMSTALRMSKKQIARARRAQLNNMNKSFMEKLKVTMESLESNNNTRQMERMDRGRIAA